MKLSYIIPTHGREGVLHKHLQELEKQTLSRNLFQVVVVRDGGPALDLGERGYELISLGQEQAGPATARNTGVEASNGDVVVFTGDDAIPHFNLLYRHWLMHLSNKPCAVQGYTSWYPQLPPLDFENFLYDSGLQANWETLKNKDGSWKREANGYCLTTNYSIHREEIDRLSKFDTEFPNAAWEDISLGYRGTKHSLQTWFEPDAINYHAHRQTFDGFLRRQQTEGKSRLVLCSIHPELAGGLLDPEGLRDFTNDKFQNAVLLAKRLHFNNDPALKQLRYQRWQEAFRYASLSGILSGIEERSCRVWQAVKHLHKPEQCHFIVSVASCLERGETGFAAMSAEWALREGEGNWAIWATKGEVELAMGRKREALVAFEKSVTLGPGEKWPLERMKEIL